MRYHEDGCDVYPVNYAESVNYGGRIKNRSRVPIGEGSGFNAVGGFSLSLKLSSRIHNATIMRMRKRDYFLTTRYAGREAFCDCAHELSE